MKRDKFASGVKKGFTMIELIFVIVVIGILAGVYVKNADSGRTEAMDKTYLDQILQNYYKGMVEFRNGNYQSTNDYSNLTPTEAQAFLDSKYFTLTGGVMVPTNFTDATVDFLPAPNSAGVSNQTFKVKFDFSNVKTSHNWSDQTTRKFENTIAAYFRGLAKSTVVGGAATTLGSANADIAESAPNADGIIVIQFSR